MTDITQKIKVMRIIARLNIGGPAIHTILLNDGLNKDKFENHLVTGVVGEGEGDMTYLAKEKGVRITVIPELGRDIRFGSDLIAFWKVFKIMRKERPHIVHTHTAKAGALGRCAAILSGIPIKVHSFHGHVFHDYFGSLTTRMFILIERMFAKFTDRVIVVSDIIKEDLHSRFKIADRKKISVMRLGLDLEKFNNMDKVKGGYRKELGLDEKVFLIGIVGRLAPIKNHRLFLEAIGLLKKEEPGLNARFLIIGGGELHKTLRENAVALGLKDWVYFTGWQKAMPRIYADLDIVVLTSLNEGTPLSLIEAMAGKRPVVATAVGGVQDLIKHEETGLLVESNNATQLKEAILRLVRDEALRRKLGGAASDYVYAAYSKERLVKDMENLYKELIRDKKRRQGLKSRLEIKCAY